VVESGDDARRRGLAMTPVQRRLLWFLVLVAWTAIALAAWQFWQTFAPPRFPRVELKPHGAYDVVEEVTGPVCVRLSTAGEVRLAGACDPQEAAARNRALAFLQNLLPVGAEVYVEVEPRAPDARAATPLATVYLPPKGAARTDPFPYAEAQLVARTMVQEGLVRADAERLFRYRTEFLLLADDARRHGRGLWGRPSP